MQLDLFKDNRPGILLNSAHECILLRDFHQAVSIYEKLLADYPDDRHALAMLKLVSEWIQLLPARDTPIVNPAHLHDIWLRLGSLSSPALRSTVLGILSDALCVLPEAERLYIEPRFHLGQVLMESGRHAEAADCFHAALASQDIPRGKFLAWRGDALTLAGKAGAAIDSYLTAFLHDPSTVDIRSITNRTIANLHTSLCFEIEEEDVPAWLPVWGWLHNVFVFPLQPDPSAEPDVAGFEALIVENSATMGRIWFDMLIHAEQSRIICPHSRELVAVRRLMKKTNGFMFNCYLEKIK